MALIQDAMASPQPGMQEMLAPTQQRAPMQPSTQPATEPQSAGTSPQEQDAYERVVVAGMKVLYDKSVGNSVLEMLRSQSDDPSKGLANTVSSIIAKLDEQSGGKIPDSVILPAADELLALAAELASKAGAFKASTEDVDKARRIMIANLMEVYGSNKSQVQNFIQGVPKDTMSQVSGQASPAQQVRK